MQRYITERFRVHRVIYRTTGSLSFVADDHWTGMDHRFVKRMKAGTFDADRNTEERLTVCRALRHPLVCNIDAAMQTRKGDFLVVREYVPGNPWPTGRSPRKLIEDLVDACLLLRTHRAVHGRLKPSNILVTSSGAQLLDAGLPAWKSEYLSEEDVPFTAPEVLRGGVPTMESDLYSLGAVLYRAHSGRDLFTASGVGSLRDKYLHAKARPLIELAEVSKDLSDAVMLLVSGDPNRSFGTRQNLPGFAHEK